VASSIFRVPRGLFSQEDPGFRLPIIRTRPRGGEGASFPPRCPLPKCRMQQGAETRVGLPRVFPVAVAARTATGGKGSSSRHKVGPHRPTPRSNRGIRREWPLPGSTGACPQARFSACAPSDTARGGTRGARIAAPRPCCRPHNPGTLLGSSSGDSGTFPLYSPPSRHLLSVKRSVASTSRTAAACEDKRRPVHYSPVGSPSIRCIAPRYLYLRRSWTESAGKGPPERSELDVRQPRWAF
jgi:hypothetical protein